MDKVKLFWSKTNRWHRGLFVLLLVELRVFPGGQLGFLCNDPALSHPFNGDTISWKWLLATSIFLPLIVMLIVERKYHNEKPSQSKLAVDWFKEYLYGLLLNLLIVETLKVIVGSPRPHFFDTCSPNEAQTCKESEYVPSYTCTKAHWLSQSDKSFPSGHTSLAVHAGVFLAYYLHRRTSATFKVMVLQVVFVTTALVCSVSRMTDHRHHWWDVLAGALIAAPVLIYTIRYLCNNFECTSDGTTTENPISIETKIVNVPLINAKET
ncbi:unnamed protein product [Spodoptera exigua]|nr:unnamed protein product [Spodoptera exigua]